MTSMSMSSSSQRHLLKTGSRGSMSGSPRFSTATTMSLDDMNIKTWILNASTIDNVTYYRILVRRGASSVIKETKRRYTDFLEFKESLLDLFDTLPTCPRCENIAKVVADFEFPKKHYFSSKSKMVVNYRMQAFRSFVSLIVGKVFNPSPKCPTCGGQVVTCVLRFLLQHATVLPENQVPRDSVFVRDSSATPTSTRSDTASLNTRGFNSFRRSVSGPPPAMNPTAQTASVRSAPGFKATSIGRFSVPKEEMEERYSSRESSMARPPPPPPAQAEFQYDITGSSATSATTLNRLSSEPVLRRPAGNDVYFDSFLADKDDKLPSPMKQFAQPIEVRVSEGPVQLSSSRTSVSSNDDDDDDDDEIDLTGLHSSVDPVKPAPKPAQGAWSGWDVAQQ